MEAIYLLHASAFLSQEKKSLINLVVKYKDGSTTRRELGGNLAADWLAEPVRDFLFNNTTTAAYTVPVGTSAKGTVYRTEWVLDNAKHDLPVESITLQGLDLGVPLILGLTGVTQW
jgi:hypothetical protein